MRSLIVANWKMYPTLPDSIVLAGEVKKAIEHLQGTEIVIAPPPCWLVPVVEHWGHQLPHVHFAAQNVWPEDQGAFTGETSVYMLKNLIHYAIVGHSERRRLLGESDELINEKVLACLKWHIRPIVCVGEEKKVSDLATSQNRVWGKLIEQLLAGVAGVVHERIDQVVIAYEPLWAIGGVESAQPEYAGKVIALLRSHLAKKYGPLVAERIQILYGGSVTAQNAADMLRQKGINGLLCGSNSLKAKDFAKICELAGKIGA